MRQFVLFANVFYELSNHVLQIDDVLQNVCDLLIG